MSDETFFREVNEEIRQQRVHDLWRRFGRWLLAGAVVAVVATGGYVAYREYSLSRANAAGDRFIAAVDLADADKFDEAVQQLQAIAGEGVGAYPGLADLRLAAIHQRQGDAKAALDGFDAVAKDAEAPKPLRDMAAIRAGYVLVDTGSLEDVRAHVERLSGDGEPLRFAAREALGLAAWKAGKLDEARRFLTPNRDEPSAPSGIALRARILMELVDAGTTPESAAAAAAAAPPAPALPDLATTPLPLDLGAPDEAAPATEAPMGADALPLEPPAGATSEAPAAEPSAAAPVAPATETPAAPAAEVPAAAAPAEAPAATTPEPAAPAQPEAAAPSPATPAGDAPANDQPPAASAPAAPAN
ncbi:hypothetical protein GCM10011390_37500 [Aureimonas endophytica]|uniref:Ancillary SecYEG translocon subunit n=1 Tax=Aureimonas endophytica TaxID=2027858 RepID=A0A916ZWH1_9HYPH|nr:tetratricopeptide repeat protein [Aureimonas endophytica]GGE14892.1 hypothetical protein GCM10011390_37500 [Aureimonas endophytica]